MKVKIDENSEFVCPDDLTVGKAYDVVSEARELFAVKNDDGCMIVCRINGCAYLNGGKWIEVPEC